MPRQSGPISQYSSDITLSRLYKRFFKKPSAYSVFLLTSFLIFILVWGTIVIGKFYSLHSYVFDLGFTMERLWQPYHVISFSFYIYVFFSSGFQFVLSPIYFLHSLQAILIAQVLAIGSSCFPIYGIAKKKLESDFSALIISIAYLIYYPSSGILWFDVHFQAFFVPLFIFAYYFYIREHYKLATLLFILSGTTRFPYIVFPFMFSVFEMANIIFTSEKAKDHAKRNSVITIFVISSIFLACGVYFDLLIPQPSIILLSSTPIISRLESFILTFIFILGPVLFLPIFKFKWLILSLPLFVLGLYSGYSYYSYPLVVQVQYTSMIVPFVFIGAIEALASAHNDSKIVYKAKILIDIKKLIKRCSILNIKLSKWRQSLLVAILCVIFLGSIFYQPYSPLNDISSINYNLEQNIGLSTSNYNTMMSLIHLIPPNNPYVLFQNDMPEMLPRPSVDNLPFLFTTYLSNNITLGDVFNNTFPILTSSGHVQYTNVDYLIAYTQSKQYYLQFAPQESTLPQILSLMIASGKYGILGEANGFILMERGYHEIPRIYEPLLLNEPFNATNIKGGSTFHNLTTPVSSSTIVTLLPGNYSVTFYISVTTASALTNIYVGLGYNLGASQSRFFSVSGSYFKTANSPTSVSFNISVPNQESNTVFLVSASNFGGNITAYNVSLIQTSY